jgi:hypothetical protein
MWNQAAAILNIIFSLAAAGSNFLGVRDRGGTYYRMVAASIPGMDKAKAYGIRIEMPGPRLMR